MLIKRKEYEFLKENAEKNINAECEILRVKENQYKEIARAMEEYSATLEALDVLNHLVDSLVDDVKLLISRWFSALEDEGAEPWRLDDCVEIANKYEYTREDYAKYINSIT